MTASMIIAFVGLSLLLAFGWLVVISFLAAHAVIWLRRPRVTTLLNRLSAAILTTFGVVTIASAE